MCEWTVEYENDVGPGDDGFGEWWELHYKSGRIAKMDNEEDAVQICGLLNRLEVVPFSKKGNLSGK